MPSYVLAAFAVVIGGFLLAAVLPAPRVAAARAARACAWIFALGGLVFTASVSIIVAAMFTPVPSLLVLFPAIAVVGLAVVLWVATLWLSKPPEAAEDEADSSTDGTDEDGGGGGGGLRPSEDPPRAPGPDGIRWDDFDREREAWESAREPVRERELSGA